MRPSSRKTQALWIALCGSLALFTSCSSGTEEDQEATAAAGGEEAASPAPVDPGSFPEVVATVNGTEIPKRDLLDRASTVEAQSGGSAVPTLDFYRDVLDDLVGAELLFQQSRELGLEAESAAVESQLDSIRQRFPNEETFTRTLEAEGLTVESLRRQIGRDLTIQKLIGENIATRVEVTEEAKRRFYDENPQDMQTPERLRVSHILKRVPPDAPAETRAAARASIEEVHQRAEKGADFAELAREHSEDPGSAANGGELVITRGQTVPPFEEAAFALDPGAVSSIVETEFGFHIIKLSERIAGQVVPYDQAQPRIEQFLRQQGIQEEVEREIESLRGEAQVQVFI